MVQLDTNLCLYITWAGWTGTIHQGDNIHILTSCIYATMICLLAKVWRRPCVCQILICYCLVANLSNSILNSTLLPCNCSSVFFEPSNQFEIHNVFVWIIYIFSNAMVCPPNQFDGQADDVTLIITLVRRKKARFDSKMHGSTQKCPVRQKKMPGSTQKCPTQNAPVDIAIIKHPPPPCCEKYFFPTLCQYFVFEKLK